MKPLRALLISVLIALPACTSAQKASLKAAGAGFLSTLKTDAEKAAVELAIEELKSLGGTTQAK